MSKKALFWFSILVIISSNIVVSATTPSLKNELTIITKIDGTQENIDNKTYNSTSYLGKSSGSPSKCTETSKPNPHSQSSFLNSLISKPEQLLTFIALVSGIYQYIYDRKKQQMVEQLKAKIYKLIVQKNQEKTENFIRFSQIKKHFYKKVAEEYKIKLKWDWQFLENIFYYVLGVKNDCFKTEEKVLNFMLELSSSDHIILITTEEELNDPPEKKPIIYLDI